MQAKARGGVRSGKEAKRIPDRATPDLHRLRVGEPWPFPMGRLGSTVKLWEHRDGSIVVAVAVDVGLQSEDFWSAASRVDSEVALLPSGPNLWCIASLMRTTRSLVEVHVDVRRLLNGLRNGAVRQLGLILCAGGVVRHIGPLRGNDDLWLVVEDWAGSIAFEPVPQPGERSRFARNDRALLSTAEMRCKAVKLRDRAVAVRSFDLAATGQAFPGLPA